MKVYLKMEVPQKMEVRKKDGNQLSGSIGLVRLRNKQFERKNRTWCFFMPVIFYTILPGSNFLPLLPTISLGLPDFLDYHSTSKYLL